MKQSKCWYCCDKIVVIVSEPSIPVKSDFFKFWDIYLQVMVLIVKSITGGSPKRSKSFFLENKVVVNFDIRHGAKKSCQSGHSFRSYGYL